MIDSRKLCNKSEEKHYHYLVVFQLKDGVGNTFCQLSKKISSKDIAEIEKKISKTNRLDYFPVIRNFKILECDCGE